MRTKPGRRNEVVGILLNGTDGLRAAGCQAYVVGLSDSDEDVIWVSEVWDTKEHHHNSLQLAAAKAAIGRAMPMLTGEFTSQGMTVAGGVGL
ncbi:antibiotic biosynthesis monooxygenase family protein [Paenarthrobacter sp. PH39-S1]|uniref:putative quinol monooxygenase n=1 Tax=Paenarthrobacter sp. PH39-S1 TaxID=3046204 RepID=UPI0024BA8758|nr:antibiotic biosynthesis monooxygenase family protein [Paenarthrobacter sp. PH39-S1]MDJ0357330.1 antibiotic biosynthesis monooxygenase family protein [Paenarthrobacter sp. PH39-S1]